MLKIYFLREGVPNCPYKCILHPSYWTPSAAPVTSEYAKEPKLLKAWEKFSQFADSLGKTEKIGALNGMVKSI